jgi:carboxyl-terminal processing protease
VNELFVDQPIDQVTLMRKRLGMMEALDDEHSSYLILRCQALQGFTGARNMKWHRRRVDPTKDYLTVIGAMPGSPAEKAGLRSGDKGIAIHGEDMTGKGGEYARQLVLGPKGTSVRLTILRKGLAEPFDVDVQRAAIVTPSVTGKMLDGNIAYLQLFTFDLTLMKHRNSSRRCWRRTLGLVIDLRNNGGGYRDTAIQIASQFIDNGNIMFGNLGMAERKPSKPCVAGGYQDPGRCANQWPASARRSWQAHSRISSVLPGWSTILRQRIGSTICHPGR